MSRNFVGDTNLPDTIIALLGVSKTGIAHGLLSGEGVTVSRKNGAAIIRPTGTTRSRPTATIGDGNRRTTAARHHWLSTADTRTAILVSLSTVPILA